MEKYHVPGIDSRERTVEPIGNLSELEDLYDDPIAHFRQRAKELTAAKKIEREQNIENMTIDMSATLESGTNDTRIL